MNVLFIICIIFERILRLLNPKYWWQYDNGQSGGYDTRSETIKINSILSWNIQELFCYKNSTKTNKLLNDLSNFAKYDLICLQEAFCESTKQKIISKLASSHPYWITGNMRKKYIIGEDSGLLVLSKMPITVDKYLNFSTCIGSDAFANKGAVYFTVDGKHYVNTHLQANYQNISKLQLQNINRNIPSDWNKYTLIGDLNTKHKMCKNKNYTHDNMVIDCIIINNSVTTNHTIMTTDNDTSDHRPVCAYLEAA